MTSDGPSGKSLPILAFGTSAPVGVGSGPQAKNERNVVKVIQVRSYQMKKIAIVLCVGLLIGLPAALTHAQLAVAKQGEQLPTLALNYLGKQPELTGKPLLVEFWATWCPPCRKSIPHLNEIYAKYKAQGLQIVGITDENEAIVKKFQKQVPMDYNVAINTPQSIYEQFGIQAIPTAFLVNKTGKIVWTGHPMELSETEIQSVLN
jgi:thiol-disulfide isomerase/thioredoxin